uniref:Putative sucrose carrier Sca1 n=1 Tax=Pneumocystis carinii TaxID=4754 RepID=Q9HEX4_PNECA|nr:putative sucrose carrier Sca1 [Pneumocystis carinii]
MIGLYAHVNASKDHFDDVINASPPLEEPQEPPLRGTLYLLFLTLVLGGLQLTCKSRKIFILYYIREGTPYLLSLGLTKHYTSFVWIAAPLTGIIIQPLIGFFSDRSRSKFGRRRPFLVVGTLCVVISLIGLAYFKDIAFFFFSGHEKVAKNMTIIVSIIIVYLLDFSINIVQASSRALIIDMVPMVQQDLANAWASRMIGIFNVVGYLNGYLNLPKIAPALGNTEFKALSVIGSIVLIVCMAVTFFVAKEKRYFMESLFNFFKTIFSTIITLPSEILWICIIQFFAWIELISMVFKVSDSFLCKIFFGTTYVAEIYAEKYCNKYLKYPDHLYTKEKEYLLIEEATRYGSFAFCAFFYYFFIRNIFLSFIFFMDFWSFYFYFMHAFNHTSKINHFFFPLFVSGKKLFKYIFRLKFYNILQNINIQFLWTFGHFIFTLCMLSTILVKSITQATIIIALCGLSWAITLWAPFSLIAIQLSSNNQLHRSGTILGVHNIFITVPQVLSIIMVGIIFKLTGYKKFEDIIKCNDNMDYSFIWIFQISGISALIAMYLSFKIYTNDPSYERNKI